MFRFGVYKRRVRGLGRSGVAAMELALLAPIMIMIMIAVIDFGAALLSRAQIAHALAGSAEYASLAGQNNVALATIAANARAVASVVASQFLATPTVTAVVNQNAAAGSKCCPGTTWSCSATAGFICADGSTPGIYLTVTAQYPFKPLFAADVYLAGKTFTDSIVVPLQ
jgi:Flp pilus assembly protein TadG